MTFLGLDLSEWADLSTILGVGYDAEFGAFRLGPALNSSIALVGPL